MLVDIHTIQNVLRDGIRGDAEQAGPFLLLIDAGSDHPFRNYAVPEAGDPPTAADVAEFVAGFRRRGRIPRVEYVRPQPALDDVLAAAGFVEDIRLTLMAVRDGELRLPPVPDGVRVDVATTDDDLRAAAAVQNVGYGGTAEVTDADLDRLLATRSAGGEVVLARRSGVPAGAGLFLAQGRGLAEVAAVATLPEHRHRGIGSVVTAHLTALVQATGATAYLQTESHNADRLYGPLGYAAVGEMSAVSLRD